MSVYADTLNPPTHCDKCHSTRIRVYYDNHRKRHKYKCRRCKASVYCHQGTKSPLGTMANGHTRYLRAKAHEVFDTLWLNGYITRDDAYAWLARQLGLDLAAAHIGVLSDKDLVRMPAKVVRYHRKLVAQATKNKRRHDATDRRQPRRKRTNGKWKPRPPSGTG